VAARLPVELGRLEETVLVVADLGRAHELVGFDEVAGRLVHEVDGEAQLGRLERHALLRNRRRFPGRLLERLLVVRGRTALAHDALVGGAAGQQRGNEQDQTDGGQRVALGAPGEHVRNRLDEVVRELALGSVDGRLDQALDRGAYGGPVGLRGVSHRQAQASQPQQEHRHQQHQRSAHVVYLSGRPRTRGHPPAGIGGPGPGVERRAQASSAREAVGKPA
jgi:hypothetical protein